MRGGSWNLQRKNIIWREPANSFGTASAAREFVAEIGRE
jgi:hypothetical protein